MSEFEIGRRQGELEDWPRDMRRVRRSAFGNRQLPHLLHRLPTWRVEARRGRKLIGYAWAYDLSDEGMWAVIDDVAVHASFQNQAVGSGLLAELVPWLREEGFVTITGMAIDPRMQTIFDRHGVSSGPPPEDTSAAIDTWVSALCDAPLRMRREAVSLLACVREAAPDLSDDAQGTAAIETHLRSNPDAVLAWQRESADTRGSPNHYVEGCEAGFYDAGFCDQLTHDNEVSACADFVYRKAAWLLQRRRVRSQHD